MSNEDANKEFLVLPVSAQGSWEACPQYIADAQPSHPGTGSKAKKDHIIVHDSARTVELV
jgi:hypothetical protein